MDKEGQTILENCQQERDNMINLMEEDAFICGFRLGVKVMLDVLGEGGFEGNVLP